MHPKLRFIHCADLHIDSLFKSKGHLPDPLIEQLRASTFEAFDRMILLAIHSKVDFVLLVGDLFNEETRSLKAQVHLRKGFEKLYQSGIDVYISHGNHDYLEGAHYPVTYPANVHIFTSEEVGVFSYEKGGEHLANIYGFSYLEREVRNRKIAEYHKQGTPQFHIAMLHGSLDTQTEHNVYAPFRMQELYEKQMDYWALGHIHKREILSESPPILYPGNIQGRSRKEKGEKGCYLVETSDNEWKLTFAPLHSFTYESISINCDHLDSSQQLEGVLEEAKGDFRHPRSSVMLEVELTSTQGHLKKWQTEGIIDEWRDIVNESEDLEDSWVWIDQTHVIDQVSWEEEELLKGHHFPGELLREMNQINDDDIKKWLSPLFHHRKAAKYLDSLSIQDEKEVIEQAKTMIIDQLLTEEWPKS